MVLLIITPQLSNGAFWDKWKSLLPEINGIKVSVADNADALAKVKVDMQTQIDAQAEINAEMKNDIKANANVIAGVGNKVDQSVNTVGGDQNSTELMEFIVDKFAEISLALIGVISTLLIIVFRQHTRLSATKSHLSAVLKSNKRKTKELEAYRMKNGEIVIKEDEL